MLKNKKVFKILFLPAVIFALALGAFRLYALLNFIEPQTGFYYSGTYVKSVFSILVILLFAYVAGCGFFTRKCTSPDNLESDNTFGVFASALCALMYLAFFVYGVYAVVSGMMSFKSIVNNPFGQDYGFLYRLINAAPDVTSNGMLFLVQVLLCIPAGLNHLSVCSKKVRKKNKHYALLSLGETLFFAFRIVEVFMDTKSQINTSQRSLEILMLCAAMLFFMYESQFLVTVQDKVSIGRYYASALGAVCFTIVAAIPYLAVSALQLYTPRFALVYVLECCVALFAVSRVLVLDDNCVKGE